MCQIRGRDIAMVFQEPMTALDPLFTVGDQGMEARLVHEKISKKAAHLRAVELLDHVRMPEPQKVVEKYPHQLSGGMRQRVVIALARGCKPKLPDQFDLSYLFISHDLSVIEHISDFVVVMYVGQVVETAPRIFILSGLSATVCAALSTRNSAVENKNRLKIQPIFL
jgi:ABC-type dipeptide/oligopeptide/nickel transport system ATPase component